MPVRRIEFPYRAVGRRAPERLRIDHLPAVQVPSLVISGTADPFGTEPELTEHLGRIDAPVTLVFVAGARHHTGHEGQLARVIADWTTGRPVPARLPLD
ncbi:MAG: hypothetical protein CSA58_02270 [Micrococcales bacterium]|nr:MAG: hypothetical protein CSA58_02270 [Micrococcales bacterium]